MSLTISGEDWDAEDLAPRARPHSEGERVDLAGAVLLAELTGAVVDVPEG